MRLENYANKLRDIVLLQTEAEELWEWKEWREWNGL